MRALTKLLLVQLTAGLLSSTHIASARGVDWPQWRGPDRTHVSTETGLLKSWPEGGPRQVWLYQNAGYGFSGPAVVNGRYFTLGTRDGSEVLLVLDANTGMELRSVRLGELFSDDRGDGPRATPTVDGNRVFVLTARGILSCVNIADGKIVWTVAMTDLGGAVPRWGYSESVLVDGNHVVCTPGGAKGALAALDKRTGEVRWRSTEFTPAAHYSSIVPARINNRPHYVQLTEKRIVGIGPKDGKVMWETGFAGRTAVVPTPIVKGNDVYVSAGYGAGCKMVRIGPGHDVTVVYENKVMKNHHGGVILIGEHLYGHSDAVGWVCQDFESGAEVWTYREFGKGAVSYAEGMLYCIEEETGTVALVEASPKGWKEHGRLTLAPQSKIRTARSKIWTHPVISKGKLYLRDHEMIYCYDLKR